MKKLFLIAIGFTLAVAVFGVAGFAYAQIQEPPEAQTSEGAEFPYGRAGWSRGSNGGVMSSNFDEDESGPLHDYILPAIAEAFGLTEAQIEAFEIARQTVQEIRSTLTPEEIRAAMQQAFRTAIENALSDGAITEEQAENWLERLEGMGDRIPGVFLPNWNALGRMQGYRQGFTTGFRFSRQMMLNHEYLDAAIVDELGISMEELQEMKADQGFNLKEYAEEQGLSEDEFTALRIEIFTKAINAALKDGVITQEQADWILERMDALESRGGWFGQP